MLLTGEFEFGVFMDAESGSELHVFLHTSVFFLIIDCMYFPPPFRNKNRATSPPAPEFSNLPFQSEGPSCKTNKLKSVAGRQAGMQDRKARWKASWLESKLYKKKKI